MTREVVREWLRREPFEPFEVQMSSGETHRVPHPEFAALTPASLIVTSPDSPRYVECALLHIASIRRLERSEIGAGP